MEENEKFVNTLIEIGENICAKFQIPVSVMIAQAIQETGYGKYLSGQCNIFGRKGVTGDDVTICETGEVYSGESVTIEAGFKNYNSLSEAITDYCDLIVNEPLYRNAFEALPNRMMYIANLSEVYATDPNYSKSLTTIINEWDLWQYDQI